MTGRVAPGLQGTCWEAGECPGREGSVQVTCALWEGTAEVPLSALFSLGGEALS